MVCVVTARLASPVAAYYPLHLDSVLAAAAVGTGHHIQISSPEADIVDPEIPIFRLRALGARCYLSTAWIWPSAATRGRTHFTARRDPEDIEAREGPWHVKTGPEKARHVPVPTIESPSVSWIVVGGRRGLLNALRHVRSVGMLRRQGYGTVAEWDVVQAVDTPPIRTLVDDANCAARHLPASWCAEGAVERGAYEAPYWHPARTRELRVPVGTPCVLRLAVLEALTRVK